MVLMNSILMFIQKLDVACMFLQVMMYLIHLLIIIFLLSVTHVFWVTVSDVDNYNKSYAVIIP